MVECRQQTTAFPRYRPYKRLLQLIIFCLVCITMFSFFDFNDVFWTGRCINSWYNTFATKQQRHFRENWCRQSQARTDWKSVLAPCIGNTRLGMTKEGWGRENATDAINSYISLWDIRPAGEYSRFSIQTQTSDGRLKTIGGDAWRVHLTGPSSIAPTVFDHGNGTYEVLFLVLEPGLYRAEIMLDYTLCDGLRDPPVDWFKIGKCQKIFNGITNV